MPLPDPSYFALFPLQELILDKDDGEPLAAGVVTFYRDDARTVLKDVYQQVQLPDNTYDFVVVNNPVTLTSIGTFSDDNGNDVILYLWPYEGTPGNSDGTIDLYFITVYAAQPPVGTGAFQFSREAWPPGVVEDADPVESFQESENIISNPQFAVVDFFEDPTNLDKYVFSVSGSATYTLIAPDWYIVTTGTGTVTLIQVPIDDETEPTNPPYALDINSSAGITSLYLLQRFEQNPRLMQGAYLSGYFIAHSELASEPTLSMYYRPSSSNTSNIEQLIAQGTASASGYTAIANETAELITLVNPDDAPTGYIEIYIDIPPLAHVRISSVQVVSVQNASSSIPFVPQSIARQVDHLFHDYKAGLLFKPIPSYLVGWDFPLNPAQILGATVAASASAASYIWDQTILFQSTASRLSASRTTSGALQIACATGATQGALIQYINTASTHDIMYNDLAVNVMAKTSNATTLQLTVSIWVTSDASLPVLPLAVVTGLNADGSVSANSGTWKEITRSNNLSKATVIAEAGTATTFNSYAFNGWNAQNNANTIALINSATYAAIVVGTAPIAIGENIQFQSISLVPGTVATIPAPQTADQVLRESQYYYEKSSEAAILPGTGGNWRGVKTITLVPNTANNNYYSIPFQLQFATNKITNPNYNVWNPQGGALGDVEVSARDTAGTAYSAAITFATYWATLEPITGSSSTVGTKGIGFTRNSNATFLAPGVTGTNGAIYFHYYADARLGVV